MMLIESSSRILKNVQEIVLPHTWTIVLPFDEPKCLKRPSILLLSSNDKQKY